MKSLFKINTEILETVNEIIENGGELTADTELKLSVSKQEFELKSVQYFHAIKQIESESIMLDNEIKRLQELKKSREKTIERLKEVLLYSMQLHGLDKIVTETLTISTRKSKSINVIDIELLPFDCLKIEKKAIKTEIKKYFDNGTDIQGAEQVENITINFK